MENIQHSPEVAEKRAHQYASDLLLNSSKNVPEVKLILEQQGIDKRKAASIVDSVASQIGAAKKDSARKDMLHGALWCGGGILVTALTYRLAQGGGAYFISWGAVVFGAVQFFKGLMNYKAWFTNS